ncbi:GvpL/GvpF family gas vesicle protein [Streptomyces sp. JJ36]|uniref:GvpL/GvpF family gas vesicle protein n=1 Tax=Streptomyces sp. JJ36 TaxID=2736645 RepID=UPI001F15CC6E|nr:GvpL/GvpF family gas vesicle protein [Streptomyces sp. JJ36]MCF6523618.1 GvpL/GvpF family gas vesicle protein [Streptomyces sp. JJ36]
MPHPAQHGPVTSGAPMLSYVYAIGRSDALADHLPGSPNGVAGGPLRAVAGGAYAAVVSGVPAAEFDEEGFRAQLEDLARLEAVARAHHTVVDFLASRATVLPLRLATVYRDDAGVARMLEESRDAFARSLDRVEGCAEWGVKVYACPGAADGAAPAPHRSAGAAGTPGPGTAASALAAPDTGTAAATSPGRAYLQQRRARRTRRQDAFQAAADAADRIAALAHSHTAHLVPHRPQSGELATGEGENVSNVSCLLPRDRADRFRAEAEESVRAVPGVRVEITGPWAPYSFAEPAPPSVPDPGGGRAV